VDMLIGRSDENSTNKKSQSNGMPIKLELIVGNYHLWFSIFAK